LKNVKDFVLGYIQKEYSIDESVDILSMNYVEAGYIDSLALVKFIAEIEDEFNIIFTDDELADPSFRIVGDLIAIIERKQSSMSTNSAAV
jgi:acyl carrier protein